MPNQFVISVSRVQQRKEFVSDEGDCVYHRYRIFLNDELIHLSVNFDAYSFNDATVYISGHGSYAPVIGRYRNFKLDPNLYTPNVGPDTPVAVRINEHIIADNIATITPEYELSLSASFYNADFDRWPNVIHVTTAGWGNLGTRIPSIFLRPQTFIITACTSIDDAYNHCHQHTPAGVWGTFYKIKAFQKRQVKIL